MNQEIEMMRVLRVPPMGKLEIEANAERYGNLADVSNPKMRQRILAAIGELVDFCGGYAVLESAGVVPQLTPAKPKPVEEVETAVSPEIKQRQEAFLATLEQQVEAEKNKPQKRGRTNSMFSANTAVNDARPLVEISETGDVKPVIAATPKPLSIAEQINQILQKQIAGNPEMANRGIRLEQSPTGGLQILADGKSYEKPADIEDTAVQEVIKTAVKTWNSTQ
ncbi:MAG: hypothetical protein IAF02_01440 [Anaerolineae bacterium]|nr:hypothetical protein [Anaerolineae bacterium]